MTADNTPIMGNSLTKLLYEDGQRRKKQKETYYFHPIGCDCGKCDQ